MQLIASIRACKQLLPGALALLAYFALAGDAQAYIDPASGSLAAQFLLGFIFGMMATAKLWYAKLKAFFQRRRDD